MSKSNGKKAPRLKSEDPTEKIAANFEALTLTRMRLQCFPRPIDRSRSKFPPKSSPLLISSRSSSSEPPISSGTRRKMDRTAENGRRKRALPTSLTGRRRFTASVPRIVTSMKRFGYSTPSASMATNCTLSILVA